MSDMLSENRIEEFVSFLSEPDGMEKQAEGIRAIKRFKALGNLGIAIVLIVIGVITSIYGIADVFGGATLPMGVIALFGGPLSALGGTYMVFVSSARVVTASRIEFATDIEALCRTFYGNVFCKKTTDFSSKGGQIVDVANRKNKLRFLDVR